MNSQRHPWSIGAACVLLVTGVAYLLSRPVVSLSPLTRNAILPGMTVAEASVLVGAPPRWYDGIRSYGFGVPPDPDNLYRPSWVSSDGQLVLEVDHAAKVTAARFAPVSVCHQDLAELVLERLTRGRGEEVFRAIVFVLLAGSAVLVWRLRLVHVGVGSVTRDDGAARAGVWLSVGTLLIAVCTRRQGIPAR